MQLWKQKLLQILHHVLYLEMEVEKYTQKWCQNLTSKMESKNDTQKRDPTFDLALISSKSKDLIPFWASFLDSILEVKI